MTSSGHSARSAIYYEAGSPFVSRYKKASANDRKIFKRVDDLSRQPRKKPCQVIGMTGGYNYPDKRGQRQAYDSMRSIRKRVDNKKSMNIFYATVGKKKMTERWAGNNVPVVADVSLQGIVSKIWQLCGLRKSFFSCHSTQGFVCGDGGSEG
jgi:hypothetical protein